MATAQPDKTGMHILLKLASLVIILAGIHAAADIIVQLLLALFFAIVLNPLVTWFIRRGVKRPLAITIVVVVMLIVLTALVGVLAASLNEFIAMLPKYSKELTRKVLHLQELMPFLNLHMSPERMLRGMDSDKIMLFTTTLMTGVSGAIIWLGLALMDIQFALMWGVLAFLLNYVPNIGSVISAVPPMIQALLFNGFYECVLVGALFLVVHMVIGNIMEPRMMGHRLGMSTLVVFLSLLVWGWLLGPVGMLLSVPLTSVCKIWMETTKGGSKLAILLGPGRPKSRLPG
ncbi:AI-2E family transporter [Salmonella enterica]|nr:AI-2E family transporter [Salmonella enterica subsp. enterica serovar Agona]EJV8441800.1 AI-2E family transporter [Salmonella enterica]